MKGLLTTFCFCFAKRPNENLVKKYTLCITTVTLATKHPFINALSISLSAPPFWSALFKSVIHSILGQLPLFPRFFPSPLATTACLEIAIFIHLRTQALFCKTS